MGVISLAEKADILDFVQPIITGDKLDSALQSVSGEAAEVEGPSRVSQHVHGRLQLFLETRS